MKYRVTRQELNECIAEAVAKVLKEGLSWDEIDAMVNNAEKDKRAAKAAQKDANKEASAAAADDARAESAESIEMNTDDEEASTSDMEPKNLPFEKLANPKNTRQARAFNKELLKRERIKQEYEEDGIVPEWGYEIDDNGNVQPTHVELGTKNPDIWNGKGGDYSGLNFGWRNNSTD